MTIDVGGHSFEGPHRSYDLLNDQSGVYAIHDNRNGRFHLIDVGESEEILTRVSNHPRCDCWERQSSGILTYSALYVNEEQRMRIEQAIRNQYNPPCGDR